MLIRTILLYSNRNLLKSFSLLHTLIQKLGRGDKDDLEDIKAILELVEVKKNVGFNSSEDVLSFLREGLPQYRETMEMEMRVMKKKLAKIYQLR